MSSDKFQVPSSLTLEPNPFEQSFAGKSSDGQAKPETPGPQQQQPQQQRLPGVQELSSPAPLLSTGQWQNGARLSPAILGQNNDINSPYRQSMPSPAVMMDKSSGDNLYKAPGAKNIIPQAHPVINTPPAQPQVPATEKRKRKKPSEPEGSEDDKKRHVFLERNRIAAVKCRQRKKQWVDSLKNKVDLFQSANEELVTEVNRLRSGFEQVKQYLYSVQDPRRIPPQIVQFLEAPVVSGVPQQVQGQQQPSQSQAPTQGHAQAQGAPHPIQPQNGQSGDYHQNVVLMVPQQMMMNGRPA